MKNWLIGFLVVVFLILAAVRFYAFTHPVLAPSPNNSVSINSNTASSSASTSAFCSPTVLQPQIETSPGAGNIWGTVTITNNGTAACQILGNNSLQAGFDSTVKNIKVTPQGQAAFDTFTLAAGQTVYSQIHYPNGPQCQGAPAQTDVTFSYKISPIDTISFRALDGKLTFSVQSCTDPSEITEIQTWPLSDKPINQ